MKLISLIFLAINLAVDCRAHEHYTFPPQFQTPHPSVYAPDKLALLPPEAHTPMPYFQVKNINNLPFPFLPPSGLKSPIGYPTPLPNPSSSFVGLRKEDEDDNDQSTSLPPYLRPKTNRTERNLNQKATRREFRPIPQNIQHANDRIDAKGPFQFSGNLDQSTPTAPVMTPRSIVISDMQRNDVMKAAASFTNPQYIPQPSVFVSSTTETAIPILRLSNEMDLDGSFSYEALGADQTHYVQHSRMENMGAGKEEQVVEGSYSYVGSDGKTYTVHYIADSNGFRAIGDHLPVAPPVPEIIQRSIQYNLAEESKKPPNLKSWNDEETENAINESERRNQLLSLSQPRINNLFTGKTPESFSLNFAKAVNTQNNLVTAASNQTPIHANIEYTVDQTQSKTNGATISPQITFLASQGAHVPSANTPQQTIARAFTTEKSTMPQLINYDASIQDSDQESNKALWRWQYGINANANQNAAKNSISRSSGDDDIVINFGDMTPEQYTTMIKQEIGPSISDDSDKTQQVSDFNNKGNQYSEQDIGINTLNNYQSYNNFLKPESGIATGSDLNNYQTERTTFSIQSQKQIKSNDQYDYNNNVRQSPSEYTQTSRPKLITRNQFIPPSQIISKSYDYAESEFESRKSKIMNSDTGDIYDMKLNVIPLTYEKESQSNLKQEVNQYDNKSESPVVQSLPSVTTVSNLKFTDFISSENKDDFKPVLPFTEPQTEKTTTTEENLQNILTGNIFLKNVIKDNKNDLGTSNKISDEKKNLFVKPVEETNTDTLQKYIQHRPKMYNENMNFNRKPIDVAAIMNFVSKNQFESSKIKTRPKQTMLNYKQNNEMHSFTPEEAQDDYEEPNTRKLRILQQNGELRGVIKNYKVLQRNNKESEDRYNGFRKNPRQSYNLPPLGRAGPSTNSYLPPIYI